MAIASEVVISIKKIIYAKTMKAVQCTVYTSTSRVTVIELELSWKNFS